MCTCAFQCAFVLWWSDGKHSASLGVSCLLAGHQQLTAAMMTTVNAVREAMRAAACILAKSKKTCTKGGKKRKKERKKERKREQLRSVAEANTKMNGVSCAVQHTAATHIVDQQTCNKRATTYRFSLARAFKARKLRNRFPPRKQESTINKHERTHTRTHTRTGFNKITQLLLLSFFVLMGCDKHPDGRWRGATIPPHFVLLPCLWRGFGGRTTLVRQ